MLLNCLHTLDVCGLMFIMILQAGRTVILIPILQVKTLSFKEIYQHFWGEKQVLILNVIIFAYLWTQPPFSPGKTKFLILLKFPYLSVFVKPSSRHTWMILWAHVAHEAAACPSHFTHIDQSLCTGLSPNCDFLYSFLKRLTHARLNSCFLTKA